jgi:hypothetical protein
MAHRFLLLVFSVLMIVHGAVAQLNTRTAKFRDTAKEDEVAKTFEDTRNSAGAMSLKRIQYRDEVQELVCTAALNDRAPSFSTGSPALRLLYKTAEPVRVTDELKRLAALDPKHKQGYKRYAVAVWQSGHSGPLQEYWVGIQFYWGEAAEFFEYHFTDEIDYKNRWKKLVADQCRKQ